MIEKWQRDSIHIWIGLGHHELERWRVSDEPCLDWCGSPWAVKTMGWWWTVCGSPWAGKIKGKWWMQSVRETYSDSGNMKVKWLQDKDYSRLMKRAFIVPIYIRIAYKWEQCHPLMILRLNDLHASSRLSSSEPVRHVSPEEIWTPDITFYHSPFRVEEADALVFANGTILYVTKVIQEGFCFKTDRWRGPSLELHTTSSWRRQVPGQWRHSWRFVPCANRLPRACSDKN